MAADSKKKPSKAKITSLTFVKSMGPYGIFRFKESKSWVWHGPEKSQVLNHSLPVGYFHLHSEEQSYRGSIIPQDDSSKVHVVCSECDAKLIISWR